MKKVLSLFLSALLILAALPICGAAAAEGDVKPTGFTVTPALYVHAVGDGSMDR